ncbi:Ada metal-binding domain-containing protein [Luteibacter sp. PPL201]|uniref:Ada metal-binding domain-containing protein n=1 Tax=Luteibacter sahnii TaxID=3021977 RepID=A0ABT6BE64_9GAMM
MLHPFPMLFDLPDHETLYRALLDRDTAYDGHVYAGVIPTGVFCRPSCPAPKPTLAHVRFHDSAAACLRAGLRPCLRCRPLDPVGQREPLVSALLRQLEDDPCRTWTNDDVAALGYEPSVVRRTFQRQLGIGFIEMARLRKVAG